MPRWLPLRISGAPRWMACPGSARATAGIDDKSNRHADRGTVAHGLLEIALRLDLEPEELTRYEGKHLKGCPPIEVDHEMIESIAHALTYVRSYLATHPNADFHPETGVDLTQHCGGIVVTGTSDIVIDNYPSELIVIDYKNGTHHVEVKDNKQVLGYALGYVVKTKRRYKTVKAVIIQPNAPGRPPVVTHTIKMPQLDVFGDDLHNAAKMTQIPNAPRHSGEHCRWCRAAGNCKEYGNRALAVARLEFKDLGGVEIDMDQQSISNEELARILRDADTLRQWLDSVHAEAIERMLAKPKAVPGFQLVCSTPRRKWDDEAKVMTAITKWRAYDLLETAPLSPAKMDKILGAKRKPHPLAKYWPQLKKYVTTNPVEPRIATLDDNRKPFKPGQEFAED